MSKDEVPKLIKTYPKTARSSLVSVHCKQHQSVRLIGIHYFKNISMTKQTK